MYTFCPILLQFYTLKTVQNDINNKIIFTNSGITCYRSVLDIFIFLSTI
jgi:hypothetical protein